MKKETFITMDYHEFDELVNKNLFPQFLGNKYHAFYEVVAYEELNNDTVHSLSGIDGVFDEYDEELLREILATGKNMHYSAALLLNELCRRGIVEPGDYLIEVSW